MTSARLPRVAANAAGVGLLLLAVGTAAAAGPRPNIIVCMGDDHGWDETGYNGHPHLQTPTLDAMAASGLRFDRFYSAHPTCSPTRGSLTTGRHPNRYGTFGANWSIRPEEIGIAQVLADAGYVCGHFGKWHLGPVKADSPTNPGALGFHEWLSHDNFFEMNPMLSQNGAAPVRHSGEGSAVVVEAAVRFIETARQQGRPFFVQICFGSPHEPYSGLEQDLARYADLPSAYREQTVRLTSNETGRAVSRPLNEVLQERYAEITAMDRELGRLRRWLDQQSLRDDTLLWYVSDNGASNDGAVTSPLRGQKGQLAEGGIRVPAVVEWPRRITEPRATDVSAVTSDVLPTICDLLELPVPDRPLDGISLEPLIEGTMTERPTSIAFWMFDTSRLLARDPEPYIADALQAGTTPLVKSMGGVLTRTFRNYHYHGVEPEDYAGNRAIIAGRYKLIVGGQRGDGTAVRELFDLRADPAEETNLVNAKPEIASQLERQLRQWQTSVLQSLTGADYPQPE